MPASLQEGGDQALDGLLVRELAVRGLDPSRLVIALNRSRPVGLAQVIQALGRPIDAMIPFSEDFLYASIQAKPLAAFRPDCNVAADVRNLAARISTVLAEVA